MMITEKDPVRDWSGLKSGHAQPFPLSLARQKAEEAWRLYYDACDTGDRHLMTERLMEAQAAEEEYNRLWKRYNHSDKEEHKS